MAEPDTPPLTFAEKHREISELATRLQESMRQALSEILPGDVGVRSIGRRLGVDKMLGSQALRIATSPDPAVIVDALPGDRGMKSLLEALAKQEVSSDATTAVSEAWTTLRAYFERHGVSAREISSIASGGLDSEAQRRHFAKMQKLQFESSVAIRGEVLNAHVSAWLVTRSSGDPTQVTLVNATMLDGFRTIRPLGPRLVHRGVAVDRDAEAGEWHRIDEMGRNEIPSFIPAASTSDLGTNTLQVRSTPTSTMVLADPDAHPASSLTLSFANLIESIGPLHATPGNRTGELSTQLSFPMRHLYLDILFAEDLPPAEPTGALYFTPTYGVEYGEQAELRRFTGKIDAKFVRSTRLPVAAGVDPEKHAAMLEHATSLVDRPLTSFRCFRLHIAYPPSFTRAVVRWMLPEKPGAGAV
jgi:hypothetical protein